MRQNKTAAAASAAILVFAVISPGVAQEPAAGRSSAQAGQEAAVGSGTQVTAPTLQITARTDQQVTGVLSRGSLRVAFTARMDTPSRAVLRLELNGITLDAEADFEKDTRTLDGHGNALSLEEHEALLELSLELERRLDPYNRVLPQHEDFLLRVVSYWSMFGPGRPIENQVVSRPEPNIVEDATPTLV